MKRSRSFFGNTVFAGLFSLALVASGSAFGQSVMDRDLFQLGNEGGDPGSATIVGDTVSAGPNWNDLFEVLNPSPGLPNSRIVIEDEDAVASFGGLRAIFLADDLSQSGLTDVTVFKGSNKNNDLISTWQWGSGNNPPKDDISNAYAYAVLNADGDLIIYAGLERLAPNGASHVDFEFNQGTVSLDEEPPCGNGSGGARCDFIGDKTIGDLLVVMDFEQGGNLSLVRLRQWNGTEYELVLEQTPTGGAADAEGCNQAVGLIPEETLCAFSNNVAINGGDWPNYVSPGATEVVDLPAKAFTEIGINISQIIGATPCLGTIQAKARSSPSFNSELKDFALGNFDLCDIEVTKTGPDLSKVGDEACYDISFVSNGLGELSNCQGEDTVLGVLGEFEEGVIREFCHTTSPEDPNPLVNIATITCDVNSTVSSTQISDFDDHSVTLFQPDISVAKTGPDLIKAGDTAEYTVTLTDNSSANTPALTCEATDALTNDGEPFAIVPGTPVTYQVVIPADAESPFQNSVDVSCEIDGFDNSIEADATHSVVVITPAIEVTKTGPDSSKLGDEVCWNISFQNTGTGAVENCTVDDSLGGALGSISEGEDVPFCTTPVGDGLVVNQATVTCDVVGLDNTVSDNDGHAVEVFNPAVSVDKTGPSLAKTGDTVTYTVTLTNNSSANTPDLSCTATDALTNGGEPFAIVPGTPVSYDYEIPSNASGSVDNTVSVNCSIAGFSNAVGDSDGHSIDVFTPSVSVDKTGPDLAKTGDTVTYTVTLTDTSSDNTPDLTCTATDALTNGGEPFAIVPGTPVSYDYEIPSNASGSVDNTVTVTCNIAGFDNQVGDSDGHSVDVFTPSVSVDKSGPEIGKVGDTVTYTVTLTDTSSENTPELSCSADDSLIGTLADFGFGDNSYEYQLSAEDVDGNGEVVNSVTVTCDIDGFDNQVGDDGSHTLTIVAPSVSLAKECSPDPVLVGDVIDWTITVTNTGDMNLECEVNDPEADLVDEPVSVPVGESAQVTASQTVLSAGVISNTATVDCSVAGLDNEINDEASADCEAIDPGPLVCRTPGFWGTHAGDDHRSGQATNLTQLVIDAAAGGALSVCGATISDTEVGSVNSAIEAMCVAVQGVHQRQLARQLTAMALNCVVSGGNADCTATESEVEELFAQANTACEAGGGGPQLGPWIDQVDCFNNGGQFVDGECLIDEEDPNNCQNRDLDESSDIFDDVSPLPGPAGSPRACSAATNNGIKVVPAN